MIKYKDKTGKEHKKHKLQSCSDARQPIKYAQTTHKNEDPRLDRGQFCSVCTGSPHLRRKDKVFVNPVYANTYLTSRKVRHRSELALLEQCASVWHPWVAPSAFDALELLIAK